MTRLLPILVAACAALSACGGGHSEHAGTSSGRVLFSQACGACHTVSGHNDARHQGGDLLNFRASRTQLLQLAAEMPMRRRLTRTGLGAVVDFLMAVETRRS